MSVTSVFAKLISDTVAHVHTHTHTQLSALRYDIKWKITVHCYTHSLTAVYRQNTKQVNSLNFKIIALPVRTVCNKCKQKLCKAQGSCQSSVSSAKTSPHCRHTQEKKNDFIHEAFWKHFIQKNKKVTAKNLEWHLQLLFSFFGAWRVSHSKTEYVYLIKRPQHCSQAKKSNL